MAPAWPAYVGLMSGTSADGVDACLVTFQGRTRLVAAISHRFRDDLRQAILSAMTASALPLAQAYELDVRLARAYTEAVECLLSTADYPHEQVRAIGCHGQTVWHRPDGEHPTSVQLGDPHRLAVATGIDVAADFRRADIAAGGQGAPLAPAFHARAFRHRERDRAIVNIGGIANVTIIGPGGSPVSGFDTGPGNALLDAWTARHRDTAFDRDGQWASDGEVNEDLLDTLLQHPYFHRRPPKSTGRDDFNLDWLDFILAQRRASVRSVDVQATLSELTAASIAQALGLHAPDAEAVFVCGGGARNPDLLDRLRARLPGQRVEPTDRLGVAAEHVEAMAFAWLAQRRIRGLAGNRPEVTGASTSVVLGSLVRAPHA